MDHYSIPLRVRRITYEDAYIAVPFSDAILRKAGGGSFQIDDEAVRAEGIRLSADHRVQWEVESTKTIEIHPVQQHHPLERKRLDFYYDRPELQDFDPL